MTIGNFFVKKICFSTIILFPFLFAIGCTTEQERTDRAVQNIKEQWLRGAEVTCRRDSLVGSVSGIRGQIEASRDRLTAAKASFSAARFSKLSQELDGYNAQVELVNQQLAQSCRAYAICSQRFNPSAEECTAPLKNYRDAQSQVRA